jgi:predicted 3-demethylubiquinone-9 3-methyltransferase (glyoxalase superfamily)
MKLKHPLATCLWFDTEAEEAANFYCSVFANSQIGQISRYGKAGQDVHHKPPGSVMVAAFEIEGQKFIALNGGPQFKFNEAVSFQVHCDTQAEIDHFWDKLTEGGQPGRCGWLKDKYGVSWQIIPTMLPEIMGGSDTEKSQRAMTAFMQMSKFDIEKLRQAYEGRT